VALYMVLNSHAPEQCEQMEPAEGEKLPQALEGRDFYCTCPAGEHAYYMFVQGDTAEEVIGVLPPSLKLGKTRAVPVEVWQL
jgi:hypothetical protein